MASLCVVVLLVQHPTVKDQGDLTHAFFDTLVYRYVQYVSLLVFGYVVREAVECRVHRLYVYTNKWSSFSSFIES